MRSRIVSKCILALTQARWQTVFKIMCSRFLAKHSAFRRAANDFNHEQMSFRPMHATSVVERPKAGAMRPCEAQAGPVRDHRLHFSKIALARNAQDPLDLPHTCQIARA